MEVIRGYLALVRVGKKQTHLKMTLFRLLAPDNGDPDYLTHHEALELEQIEVTEVSESGSVPDLRLINRGQEKVLIIEGEELQGAKQKLYICKRLQIIAFQLFCRRETPNPSIFSIIFSLERTQLHFSGDEYQTMSISLRVGMPSNQLARWWTFGASWSYTRCCVRPESHTVNTAAVSTRFQEEPHCSIIEQHAWDNCSISGQYTGINLGSQ